MSAKILLVEDSESQLEFLRDGLTKKGFDVETARNGAEAYKKLFECMPDLVLSDIMMPAIDGYQLCRLIKNKEETKKIPVILLTILDKKIDKKYSFPTYYPYVDISSVNLGTMVEKLSQHYKDKKRLEISEYTDNHILERIMKSRDEFLASLNQIDVSEISKCDGQKTNNQQ